MAANTIHEVGNPTKPVRLMSLDALRGFNMFWIVGAESLVAGLRKINESNSESKSGLLQGLAEQLSHVKWEGFHFEDLIFPMFVFMVGVSIVFSLERTIEQQGRRAAVMRVLTRAIALYLLGIFYSGGIATYAHIRLLGVLQRIAICYLCAGVIFIFCNKWSRVAWCVGLLASYWALMEFVPVPGGTAGDFREEYNLANWIDKHYLPLWKYNGDHDPEGLLSTLPAISNCLIGVFAGLLLRDGKQHPWRKAALLALAGAVLVGLGWLWNPEFPVIKKIWTSSFVLVACGYSCLFLATFYQVIDVCGWKRWSLPFVWIGMNSIFIYLLVNVVKISEISKRFVDGDVGRALGNYQLLALAVLNLLIVFGVARFLYRRKVFIRL